MRPERGPRKALIRSDNFEQQLNVKPFISVGKEGNIYSLLVGGGGGHASTAF